MPELKLHFLDILVLLFRCTRRRWFESGASQNFELSYTLTHCLSISSYSFNSYLFCLPLRSFCKKEFQTVTFGMLGIHDIFIGDLNVISVRMVGWMPKTRGVPIITSATIVAIEDLQLNLF